MKKIVLDGNKQKTPVEIYQVFSKELDFGLYFGNNADALYDFMVPIDLEDQPLIIEWKNSELFQKNYPKEFEQIIAVFNRINEFQGFDNDIFKFSFK